MKDRTWQYRDRQQKRALEERLPTRTKERAPAPLPEVPVPIPVVPYNGLVDISPEVEGYHAFPMMERYVRSIFSPSRSLEHALTQIVYSLLMTQENQIVGSGDRPYDPREGRFIARQLEQYRDSITALETHALSAYEVQRVLKSGPALGKIGQLYQYDIRNAETFWESGAWQEKGPFDIIYLDQPEFCLIDNLTIDDKAMENAGRTMVQDLIDLESKYSSTEAEKDAAGCLVDRFQDIGDREINGTSIERIAFIRSRRDSFTGLTDFESEVLDVMTNFMVGYLQERDRLHQEYPALPGLLEGFAAKLSPKGVLLVTPSQSLEIPSTIRRGESADVTLYQKIG